MFLHKNDSINRVLISLHAVNHLLHRKILEKAVFPQDLSPVLAGTLQGWPLLTQQCPHKQKQRLGSAEGSF